MGPCSPPPSGSPLAAPGGRIWPWFASTTLSRLPVPSRQQDKQCKALICSLKTGALLPSAGETGGGMRGSLPTRTPIEASPGAGTATGVGQGLCQQRHWAEQPALPRVYGGQPLSEQQSLMGIYLGKGKLIPPRAQGPAGSLQLIISAGWVLISTMTFLLQQRSGKKAGRGEHGHRDVIISLVAIQAAGEEASSFLGHLPSAPEREG